MPVKSSSDGNVVIYLVGTRQTKKKTGRQAGSCPEKLTIVGTEKGSHFCVVCKDLYSSSRRKEEKGSAKIIRADRAVTLLPRANPGWGYSFREPF